MIDEWTTRDGRTLKIKDMTTEHLYNVIKYLKKNPIIHTFDNWDEMGWFEEDLDLTKDYIKAFEKELVKRSTV